MAFESEEIPASAEVAGLNLSLRDASPQIILRTALERYRGRIALVSSFGAESAVRAACASFVTGTAFANADGSRATCGLFLVGILPGIDLRPRCRR